MWPPTAAAKSLQSCLTLCDPIDSSPPGSLVPGILQARTLEWVAISFSNAWKWKVKSEIEVTQSCLTLQDPMDCSPPGSSVHGIFQAGVLEWATYLCPVGSSHCLPLSYCSQGELPSTCKSCLGVCIWESCPLHSGGTSGKEHVANAGDVRDVV